MHGHHRKDIPLVTCPWKKNAERFKEGAQEKCRELFEQIDALNAAEDKQYAGADLEERGLESKKITTESIGEHV